MESKRAHRIVVPIVIIVALVAVIAWLLMNVGKPLIEELRGNEERVDLMTYLGLSGQEDVYVMLGETSSSTKAIVRGGSVYWEEGAVRRNFTDCFWLNHDEKRLFLTTADEVVIAGDGELFYTRHAEAAPAPGIEPQVVMTDVPVFFIENGRGYIALEYAKQFSNFSYNYFTYPHRIQIYTGDMDYEGKEIIRKTELRVYTDINSEIVTSLRQGEKVFVLAVRGEWTKVRTDDALFGYVENKYLSEDSIDVEIRVPKEYIAPPYTDLTEDRRILIGWHQVSVADANAYLADRVDMAWPLDVVSPTWYTVEDGSGAVISIAWKSYVDIAHARGLQVWPLVDDFFFHLDPDIDRGAERYQLLMSTESRNRFVSYLIEQANELGFDGINLDFEVVPLEAAGGYSQLLRELSVACRAHGIVFSIDNYPPRPHSEHYNRRLQGQVADYVIIMGYDEHWSASSGPGSVSSLPFVVDAIVQTTAVVPAHKVINAVPLYTRIWSTNQVDGTVKVEQTVGQRLQDEWVAKREIEPEWDEELGQYYAEYLEGGKLYQVWMENEASMQARIDAMSKFGLGGAACWRLGLEQASIWDILDEYTKG